MLNKTIGIKNIDNFISQYITSILTQIQEVKYGYVGKLNLYMRENVLMLNIIYQKSKIIKDNIIPLRQSSNIVEYIDNFTNNIINAINLCMGQIKL